MGFDTNDSQYLRNEYCKQALKQYLLGNYVLKNLDKRGQRLAIPITLNETTFYSGWTLSRRKNKKHYAVWGWIK